MPINENRCATSPFISAAVLESRIATEQIRMLIEGWGIVWFIYLLGGPPRANNHAATNETDGFRFVICCVLLIV